MDPSVVASVAVVEWEELDCCNMAWVLVAVVHKERVVFAQVAVEQVHILELAVVA